VEGVPFVPVIS